MLFSVLGSGSRGNCVYVESGKTGFLIDAGFSGKETEKRLALIERDLSNIQAILLTHEHNDHIRGAGVISRKIKIPIYSNRDTFRRSAKRLGKLFGHHEFVTGNSIEIDHLSIRSFRISHDTVDPVGFVVDDGASRLGCCTDTGKVSHLMINRLVNCNGLILEFNHNLDMLKNGPYPLPLQQRIRSNMGHLSNEDAAELLSDLATENLKAVVLAHLSEANNHSELAMKAVSSGVQGLQDALIVVATQGKPTELIQI